MALSHVEVQVVFVKPLVAFQETYDIAVPTPVVLFEDEIITTSELESLLKSPEAMSVNCPNCNIPPPICGVNDMFKSAVNRVAECGNNIGSDVVQFDGEFWAVYVGITL